MAYSLHRILIIILLLLRATRAGAQAAPGAPLAAQADEVTTEAATQSSDRPVIRYEAGADGSIRELVAGLEALTVTGDSISVTAVILELSNPVRLWVMVGNGSSGSVDVYPDSVELLAVGDSLLPLTFRSAASVAKSIENEAMWAAALTGLANGLAGTSTSRTSGTVSAYGTNGYSSGAYSGQTRTYSASANAAQINEIIASGEEKKARAVTGALLATTVRSGQFVEGTVFFKRKKASKYVARVRLPHVICELPLLPPPKE